MTTMTTKNTICPGTYRLKRDMPALKPDKRKRYDWRADMVKADTLFCVDQGFYGHNVDIFHMWPSGDYESTAEPLCVDGVISKPDWADALEPVQETPSMWFRREHNGYRNLGRDVLDRLVADGVITLSTVQRIVNEILNGGE